MFSGQRSPYEKRVTIKGASMQQGKYRVRNNEKKKFM
jgi:hypothetical protein